MLLLWPLLYSLGQRRTNNLVRTSPSAAFNTASPEGKGQRERVWVSPKLNFLFPFNLLVSRPSLSGSMRKDTERLRVDRNGGSPWPGAPCLSLGVPYPGPGSDLTPWIWTVQSGSFNPWLWTACFFAYPCLASSPWLWSWISEPDTASFLLIS